MFELTVGQGCIFATSPVKLIVESQLLEKLESEVVVGEARDWRWSPEKKRNYGCGRRRDDGPDWTEKRG